MEIIKQVIRKCFEEAPKEEVQGRERKKFPLKVYLNIVENLTEEDNFLDQIIENITVYDSLTKKEVGVIPVKNRLTKDQIKELLKMIDEKNGVLLYNFIYGKTSVIWYPEIKGEI